MIICVSPRSMISPQCPRSNSCPCFYKIAVSRSELFIDSVDFIVVVVLIGNVIDRREQGDTGTDRNRKNVCPPHVSEKFLR